MIYRTDNNRGEKCGVLVVVSPDGPPVFYTLSNNGSNPLVGFMAGNLSNLTLILINCKEQQRDSTASREASVA